MHKESEKERRNENVDLRRPIFNYYVDCQRTNVDYRVENSLDSSIIQTNKSFAFIVDWNSILFVSFVRVSLCLLVYRDK